jgi:hypothetical protein
LSEYVSDFLYRKRAIDAGKRKIKIEVLGWIKLLPRHSRKVGKR